MLNFGIGISELEAPYQQQDFCVFIFVRTHGSCQHVLADFGSQVGLFTMFKKWRNPLCWLPDYYYSQNINLCSLTFACKWRFYCFCSPLGNQQYIWECFMFCMRRLKIEFRPVYFRENTFMYSHLMKLITSMLWEKMTGQEHTCHSSLFHHTGYYTACLLPFSQTDGISCWEWCSQAAVVFTMSLYN